jgi:hypothetical protein
MALAVRLPISSSPMSSTLRGADVAEPIETSPLSSICRVSAFPEKARKPLGGPAFRHLQFPAFNPPGFG